MITADKTHGVFRLDTEHTSYAMAVVDGKYLVHVHFGGRISDTDLMALTRCGENPYVPSVNPAEKVSYFGTAQPEYSCFGMGDFREACLDVKNEDGQRGTELVYQSYEILHEKPALPALPASFGEKCETLVIELADEHEHLSVFLRYSVFADADVIVRSARIVNRAEQPVFLERALSACLHIEDEGRNFRALTFSGTWAREHRISTQEIGSGGVSAEALRGECGHSTQPFIAVLSEDCGEDSGEVYAMHFVYSGNFLAKVQKDPFDQIRMVMGIHPETFEWKLEPTQEFQTPEAVLVYSGTGLGGMSRTLHDFYRNHLIRSPWQFRERPILINNWEATYFDFDSDKLVSIADEASRLGINMLVCDDGWFGSHRDQPSSGLGDWTVNEKKIHPVHETEPESGMAGGLSNEKSPEEKDGMRSLINALLRRHMKFGLWFEPEMISKDSELFRKHSDWVLHLKGREPGLCRDQWVLDYSNPAVTDFIFESIAALLRKYDIAYLKWDMNRPLTDAGSEYLPADRQGEIWHRHVLGLYSIQERLVSEFPELLIENCSSGGARFDPGMLYYSPQIWCSDDMDPIERLSIEEGTELLYPLSTMGAHVCKSPNDISKRVVPFATRALMAMTGTFGYELDITKIPENERRAIPAQISLYKTIRPLIQKGDLYRIASFRKNHEWDAVCVMAKDKKTGFFLYVQGLYVPNAKSRRIRLKGLDPDRRYTLMIEDITGAKLKETDAGTFGGDTLMHAGLLLKRPEMDFGAVMVRILAEDAGR